MSKYQAQGAAIESIHDTTERKRELAENGVDESEDINTLPASNNMNNGSF